MSSRVDLELGFSAEPGVPAGDIGVGVSILSYAGGVQFSLITDARMCPDPDDIVRRFQPEFDKLLYLALMLPWDAR